MPDYSTLKELRAGRIVQVGGKLYKMDDDGEVKQGDWYIAERNTGPELLQAKTIFPENGRPLILPEQIAYGYNTHECIKVIQIPGEVKKFCAKCGIEQ